MGSLDYSSHNLFRDYVDWVRDQETGTVFAKSEILALAKQKYLFAQKCVNKPTAEALNKDSDDNLFLLWKFEVLEKLDDDTYSIINLIPRKDPRKLAFKGFGNR